jgi:hypothetical protein
MKSYTGLNKNLGNDLTMMYRSGRVNPIAKALLQTDRRRSQVVPDKTKYNRKKEKDNANKGRSNEKSEG